MAEIRPFRALRPRPPDAAHVAAVPYDVVSTEEAREMAEGRPLSFLRVSRAEIELDATVDPHSEVVYRRAARNFERLKRSSLVVEDEPSVYVYRLQTGGHEQTGLAACFSLDDYEHDVIRKHERTRHDKELDRTRHILALGAQTGLVFLTYRASPDVDRLTAGAVRGKPLFDFDDGGSVHTVWRVSGGECSRFVHAFQQIPTLYIADGHHRAAGALRARDVMRKQGASGASIASTTDFNALLAVAFPHDQVRILPYNRVVGDLGDLSPATFIAKVRDRFAMEPGPAVPFGRGEIAMYFDETWRTLRLRGAPVDEDPVASLDVSVLQDNLLAPILGIADPRTDSRIEFIGGVRGTLALEQLVDRREAAVAFSLFPVNIAELMAVADGNGIMPPKSTWFDPKPRDGLLIHEL
jgi:uncharacterized protein (DUF1015 family)